MFFKLSLWSKYAIWHHRTRPTMAQVMACCLVAPSHYLNRCRFIIKGVLVAYAADIIEYIVQLRALDYFTIMENIIRLCRNGFIFVRYLVHTSTKAYELHDMQGKYYLHGIFMSCSLYQGGLQTLCNMFNHIQYYIGTSYNCCLYILIRWFYKNAVLERNNIHKDYLLCLKWYSARR